MQSSMSYDSVQLVSGHVVVVRSCGPWNHEYSLSLNFVNSKETQQIQWQVRSQRKNAAR